MTGGKLCLKKRVMDFFAVATFVNSKEKLPFGIWGVC